MAKFDLFRESQDFAQRLTDLLNKTVCNNTRLTAAVERSTGAVVVTNKPDKSDLARMTCVPICLSGKPKLYLGLSIRLRPDYSGQHLMVVSSAMLLAGAVDGSELLLHYDYERDKQDGYPEAHVQVCASSARWEDLLGGRPFKRLHLPVGGRRFRPTLEDLIEFLIAERLAEFRPGWKQVVDDHRHEFQMIQLRAAIRRHPDVAREALAELDRDD